METMLENELHYKDGRIARVVPSNEARSEAMK
jgi:hypothetical protein